MRDLAEFTGAGYDKGRSLIWQACWFACSNVLFTRWWLPCRLRPLVLRCFGAEIGQGVIIKHNVRIHWPWKLRVGNHTWLGEDVWILNLEHVAIGDNVCLSQKAFVCTGSHDRRSPTFEFDNAPIVIEDGVWCAAGSSVYRGVVVGPDAVIAAGTQVFVDVPPRALVR